MGMVSKMMMLQISWVLSGMGTSPNSRPSSEKILLQFATTCRCFVKAIYSAWKWCPSKPESFCKKLKNSVSTHETLRRARRLSYLHAVSSLDVCDIITVLAGSYDTVFWPESL